MLNGISLLEMASNRFHSLLCALCNIILVEFQQLWGIQFVIWFYRKQVNALPIYFLETKNYLFIWSAKSIRNQIEIFLSHFNEHHYYDRNWEMKKINK